MVAGAPRSRSTQRAADDLFKRLDRVLEPVVDDDVRELALGLELLAGGVEPRLDLVGVVGPAADEARPEGVLRRGRDEDPDGLGHRAGDLAGALDLDLQHDRGTRGRALLELGAEGSVAAAGVARVLDEVARVDAAGELVLTEEVVGDAVLLPRSGTARGGRHGELELGDAL